MNSVLFCVLLAGFACITVSAAPATAVKNPANPDVFFGTFISDPEKDFQTNMMQVYHMIDPTGNGGCAWLPHVVTFSVIKLDDTLCFVSYMVGDREFLGATVNLNGSPSISPILDGSTEVSAVARKNIAAEVLSSHLKPATSALSTIFTFLDAVKDKPHDEYPPLTMSIDMVFPAKSGKATSEMIAVISLGGGETTKPVRGEMHFQRQ